MVDSSVVLAGQTAAYTLYVLAVMAVMVWFALRVTRAGARPQARPLPYVRRIPGGLRRVAAHHYVQHDPVGPIDLNRAEITPDRVYTITVQDHKFTLPAERLVARVNEKVLFDVRSMDLTYGFGLFREDHSMVCQMQVLPDTSTTCSGCSTVPGPTRSAPRSTRVPPASAWSCPTRSW